MDQMTARPNLLKQVNLSKIRKVIKDHKTATRGEIANETKISSTTVRSLLAEMIQDGELESIGYDASSGGRKAERYRFAPGKYYGAAFCLTDSQVHGLLINVCGEIVESVQLPVTDGDIEQPVWAYLDELTSQKEIKAIGVGVPGVVERGCFWRMSKDGSGMAKSDIGEALKRKYGIPVILENDINATAIGFARCYQREFPREDPEKTNMAYLHFEEGCVSAGFVAGGKIVRGCNNFAGELGLIPVEGGKMLDQCMSATADSRQYCGYVIQILCWLCGILNPEYVALGGPAFRKEYIAPVVDGMSAYLPQHMIAEILYAPDVWNDYYDGIAHLTAGKMFDEVQLIKE